MRIVAGSYTTKGHKPLNEDRVLVGGAILSGGGISVELSGRALFAVFDGVSTGGEGGLAAQISAEIFYETCCSNPDLPVIELVALAAKTAQGVLDTLKHKRRINSLSACTVTGICLGEDGDAAIFNAGDSRTYRIRNSVLAQLTTDNTVISQMIRDGAPDSLIAEACETESHAITHALGMTGGGAGTLDLNESFVVAGDTFFICSDGVTDVLADSEIESMLDARGQEQACECVVTRALDAGAMDNVSATIIRVFN